MSRNSAAPIAERDTANANADAAFMARVRAETALLRAIEERGELPHPTPSLGVELEAWLIDVEGRPAARNDEFVAALGSPAVRQGLARSQIELRLGPCPLAQDGLARLAAEWQTLWSRCHEAAARIDLRVVAVGILPTVDDADLTASQLSDAARFARRHSLRSGTLARLAIRSAREELQFEHRDVFCAAAATSLAVQLQIGAEAAARFFNASIIAAAAAVGMATNAPFLFGTDLWDDTRLPLLEQATAADVAAAIPGARCGLGARYLESIAQYFEDALRVPALAGRQVTDAAPSRFEHLRQHADTLHHWVRPRLAIDDADEPQLHIEQRALSPGPTAVDMLANTCFHVGLVSSLATEPEPPEWRLPIERARASLHAAARMGLQAEVAWLDGETMPLRTLAIVDLIERAYEGLDELGVSDDIARRHLSIIERRVASGQTAAVWQRRFVNAHGRNFALLMRETAARQLGGAPVHEWHLRRLT